MPQGERDFLHLPHSEERQWPKYLLLISINMPLKGCTREVVLTYAKSPNMFPAHAAPASLIKVFLLNFAV